MRTQSQLTTPPQEKTLNGANVRGATTRMLAVALSLFVATLTGIPSASGQNRNPQEEMGTSQSLPTLSIDSIFGSFKLNRLGGEKVSIWHDKREGSKYYYPPSLLPEWNKFSQGVSNQCPLNEPNKHVSVRLLIYLSDESYENEIRAKIAESFNLESLDEHLLSAIPHDNIQIVLKETAHLESRVIYEARGTRNEFNDSEHQRIPLLTYKRAISTRIAATCTALRNVASMGLLGEDIMSGRIYFHSVVYKTTSFWVTLKQFLISDRTADLFGEESLVKRMNYSNRLGFTDDESGPNLLLRLPVIRYSGSAESSRQRLLSRDYIDYVSSSTFMGIVGGCVEASASSNECQAIREQFMTFLISHAKSIEVTFRKLEDGSFELINNQIAYATLSPEQYESIGRAAPSFEGKVDGETIKSSDNIVWEFRGDEPTPTKAELHLVDEQRLRSTVNVIWYERMPVEDTARQFVASLNYFPLKIADRRILPLEEFLEWENLKFTCQDGGQIREIAKENILSRSGGGVRADHRSITHHTKSSKCRISFSGGWKASDGFFFLAEADIGPITVVRKWSGRSWRFSPKIVRHTLDVSRGDGSAQMISSAKYTGRSTRGHRWLGKHPCGAEIQFNLQQYPIRCAPFLVEGYEKMHRVSGANNVERE